MNQVILCYGKYAKRPYYVAEECQSLYSIEELCYYIYHNAYLMEDSFLSVKLIQWIKEELELPELAEKISKFIGTKFAIEKAIMELMNEVGYYSKEEWEELITFLKGNNHLTIQEKRKLRADSLLHNQKYCMASDEYSSLLKEVDETQVKLLAKIYHNLGVCAANQFLFQKAAEFFKKAYDTYANTESYVQFLTALKMGSKPQEYLDYLSGHPESYEDSLEVERNMEMLKQGWEVGPSVRFFQKLWDEKGKGNLFYEEIDRLTELAKEEYRTNVFRSSNG